MLSGDDAFKCDACKCTCEARKRLQLWAYPVLLVLSLKRFTKGGRGGGGARGGLGGLRKTSTPLQLDAGQLLDLSPFTNPEGLRAAAANGQPPPLYELLAVVDHCGSLVGGHYSARGASLADGRWREFNDCRVDPEAPPCDGSRSAYTLMFRLCCQQSGGG